LICKIRRSIFTPRHSAEIAMPDDTKGSERLERLAFVGGIVAVAGGLYAASLISYLLFHALIELATISVAFTLFILGVRRAARRDAGGGDG
jgi:hypothetical protein